MKSPFIYISSLSCSTILPLFHILSDIAEIHAASIKQTTAVMIADITVK